MVKKLQKMSSDKKSGPQLSNAVKESAQQIWLAGLGAFSKAQEEGSKVFETLVKEGLSIQRKTQAVAEERLSEATTKVSTMASDIQSRAGNQWDKLENIFEDRVAKALGRLGVPSAKEVSALTARIAQLEKQSAVSKPKPSAARTQPKPAKKSASRTSAAKRPAKKAAARPTSKVAAAPAAKKPRAKRPTARVAAPAPVETPVSGD